MNKVELEQAVSDTKLEISREIDRFSADLDSGLSDAENFMTLSEIEQKWSELQTTTSKLYSDLVATHLRNHDESAVIKSKKENTGKRG